MRVSPKESFMAAVMGVFFVLVAFSSLSEDVEGAVTDKTVLGTVYDQVGDPLPGADVTVEIWGGWWPEQDFLRITDSTITDAWGQYEVTFNSNYWDPHNTIKVIVTSGFAHETEMVEADEDPYQTVDVTIDLTIPEFSGPLGLVAMIVGCMIPIVLFLARRRKQS